MSYDSWTILMVKNGPGLIADGVRNSLKAAACNLTLKKWDKMHIVNDHCTGRIQTAWTTHNVGGRSGVLFRAQVESDDGEYLVNFLLSTEDLERGAEILRKMEEGGQGMWADGSGQIPCPELYEFYDLTESNRLN